MTEWRNNNVQGTTTAAVLADKNPETYFMVVDSDKDRIDAWNAHRPPIQEPGLVELLAKVQLRWDGSVSSVEPDCRGKGKARTPNLAFFTDVKEGIINSEII